MAGTLSRLFWIGSMDIPQEDIEKLKKDFTIFLCESCDQCKQIRTFDPDHLYQRIRRRAEEYGIGTARCFFRAGQAVCHG